MGITSKTRAADVIHTISSNALSETDWNLKIMFQSQEAEVGGMDVRLG